MTSTELPSWLPNDVLKTMIEHFSDRLAYNIKIALIAKSKEKAVEAATEQARIEMSMLSEPSRPSMAWSKPNLSTLSHRPTKSDGSVRTVMSEGDGSSGISDITDSDGSMKGSYIMDNSPNPIDEEVSRSS